MKYVLIYFALKYKGDFDKIYNAIKDKEIVTLEEIESIRNKVLENKINAITIMDEDYPESLKLINRPPFVLFYEGNKNIINNELLCITGDEENETNKERAKEAINILKNNSGIVNSLFKGMDEFIVDEAKTNKKNIILISANGIEEPYFSKKIKANENILIMSEYPPKVNISKRKLIARNRIVAGLSEILVIINSKSNSGIMNLVSFFLENGKEIYCFPENDKNDSDGNFTLIKEGANKINSIKDTNVQH